MMNDKPAFQKDEWIWLQRPTSLYQQFGAEVKADDLRMRSVLALMAFIGHVGEQKYDAINETENFLLHKDVLNFMPVFVEDLKRLGWVVQTVKEKDPQERSDFYDALLKGGTLQ